MTLKVHREVKGIDWIDKIFDKYGFEIINYSDEFTARERLDKLDNEILKILKKLRTLPKLTYKIRKLKKKVEELEMRLEESNES